MGYIWYVLICLAEPPDIGEDYIFPGTSAARGNTDQASEDALPDYDYLLKWYEGAFDHFVSVCKYGPEDKSIFWCN